MKLLFCLCCSDIFPLDYAHKSCSCQVTGGNYLEDGITAEVFTRNKRTAVVLGFANSTLVRAVKDQLAEGDLPATMPYCGKIVSPGRDFKAFVIPESADSVVWKYAE
jgi:hypothetical protein